MRLKPFLIVTKPKQTLLLIYSAMSPYFFALKIKGGETRLLKTAVAFTPLLLVLMGTNTLNNYLDRDIDAKMERTINRPLPKGEITPAESLTLGLALLSTGLILSLMVSFHLFTVALAGSIIDLIVYTKILKRRTPINILIGSVAGGLLPIYGWLAAVEKLNILPVLIGGLIVLWTPSHIWSLALFHREDYRKVEVPMLPVVKSEKLTVKLIALTNLATFILSILIGLKANLKPIYFLAIAALSLVYLSVNFWGLLKPSLKIAKTMFKASSPFLGATLTLLMVTPL